MSIDLAVSALQDLSLACTSVAIKSAPDYPIENADPFPFSVAYFSNGTFYAVNSDTLSFFPVMVIEFHFSRVNLKRAYQNINSIALEFARKLAGNPTLNSTVATIKMTQSEPIRFTVSPFKWGNIDSEMLKFEIPVKTLETPST